MTDKLRRSGHSFKKSALTIEALTGETIRDFLESSKVLKKYGVRIRILDVKLDEDRDVVKVLTCKVFKGLTGMVSDVASGIEHFVSATTVHLERVLARRVTRYWEEKVKKESRVPSAFMGYNEPEPEDKRFILDIHDRLKNGERVTIGDRKLLVRVEAKYPRWYAEYEKEIKMEKEKDCINKTISSKVFIDDTRKVLRRHLDQEGLSTVEILEIKVNNDRLYAVTRTINLIKSSEFGETHTTHVSIKSKSAVSNLVRNVLAYWRRESIVDGEDIEWFNTNVMVPSTPDRGRQIRRESKQGLAGTGAQKLAQRKSSIRMDDSYI